MCNLIVKQICFVLLVCFAFVNTKVTIENGGYSVLVSFSQNVKSTEGLKVLEKMKESLQKASFILYNTIGRQFTKVTFEIPESWNTSQMEININSSSVTKYAKSDFLIDSTNDVIFGKFPFAQQYGGCGIPGHQITIPTAFFSDDNGFPRGTALAREWLKYRYGVFDENGYEQDPLYPLYRLLPLDGNSELKVTECTNNPVAYDLKSDGETFSESDQYLNNPSKSKLVPDKNTLGNVTSSIMYFHQDIPDLLHICGKNDDHPHNALSPNKHNTMCRSQSIWEIVRQSEDFGTDPKEYSDIEFIYAQERRLKVVVAWENTRNVGEQKGGIILNAIKRFVYELPRGTMFNGFPFSNTLSSKKDYTLKQLQDLTDKNDIVADIILDFEKKSNGNITLAVLKALEILSSDSGNSGPEGTIIVISKSGEGISNTLFETIEKFDVCVKVLSLSEGNTSHQAEYYNAASTCGFPEDISTDKDEDIFKQLFSSMEDVLPATVDDKITETVKTGYLSQGAPIALQVDETVEKVTFWIFPKKEVENFKMKFDKREENLQVLKTTTDTIMALYFNPGKAGNIEIAYPEQIDPIFMQVRFTFKAGKYLNGFLYIHDTTTAKSSHQMPVIIYAVIRYGAYPVQDAQVKTTIERPDESPVSLEMFDDGRGDPDITGNDGVYSRYFTQFNEKGVYTVDVTVEITDSTSYGVNKNADYQTCCGSFLETVSSKIPVSNKNFKTFFIAKSGRPDTGYKPSRITDLRIGDVLDDKIVLKWSAPGEEGDSGKVDSYEVKLYTSHEDAAKGVNGMILNNTVSPLERGSPQTLELAFSGFKDPGLYYITLRAKNQRKSGDVSPILEIFVPDKQTPTTPTPDNETDNDGSAKTAGSEKRNALIIGLVVGLIVLLILIILVVYFVVVKPKRKEAKANSTTSNTTERGDNHVISPITFVSADTLIRHHNEKTLARRENKEPPIFREEDFDDTESSQTQESPDNNNIQQPEGSQNARDNEERLPPKSPKKTTYV